jgi:hypothetical protein
MRAKMTSFEEIKSQWKDQKAIEIPNNGHKIIIDKVNDIKKKQKQTNIILFLTILVLIAFFVYIAAYKYLIVASALLLMIGSLAVRIGLELQSIKKLSRLNVNISASSFKENIISYYKNRVHIHLIWTPIIILIYSIGFVMMLPSFKASLSSGFYTYILVSSVVILVILSFFIYKQIMKELSVLKELTDKN